MKHNRVILVLLTLLVTMLACGTGGYIAHRNNDIRRAALAYELSTRGSVDEVLVAFELSEVRDDLGFKDGNTVWLNWIAEPDYFKNRDTRKSYLFLHGLDYADGTDSILVDRGDPSGMQSHHLTLQREGDAWRVTSDELAK
jgi:hypothetical protein